MSVANWTRGLQARIAAAGVLALLCGVVSAVGAQPTAAVSLTRPLFVWGNGNYGELGDGTTNNVFTPESITLPDGVNPVAVSAGSVFSLALGSDARIYSWGANYDGQLGNGTITSGGFPDSSHDVPAPITLPGAMTAVAVSAGLNSSLALGSDGLVYAWGDNTAGQLGDGTTTRTGAPEQILLPGGDKARAVYADLLDNASAAIGVDGRLFVWGSNYLSGLGDGTATNRHAPVEIHLLGGDLPRSISLSQGLGLAVGADGRLFSWGANYDGQLGDGTTVSHPDPREITLPGGVHAAAAVADEADAMALGTDGKVYTWGANFFGELGDGTTTGHPVPAAITLPGGVTATAITTGGSTDFALGSDGSLSGWGANTDGSLGNGTVNASTVPLAIPLPGGASAAAVSSGSAVLVLPRTSLSAPAFSAAAPPLTAEAGEQYGYTFSATGDPAPTFALAPGAPGWLAVDPATGRVSGTVPAGITGFGFTVTAANSQGAASTSAYAVNVLAVVPVRGHVRNAGGDPDPGSLVQLCGSAGCTQATADAAGAYALNAVPGPGQTLTAFPPAAEDTVEASTSVGPLTVPDTGLPAQDISFTGYGSLPASTVIAGSFQSGGLTTLLWTSPYPITVAGCPNGIGTATITAMDGSTGRLDVSMVALAETAPGSGQYNGTLPPLVPAHGPAQIGTSVICMPRGHVVPQAGPAAGGTSVVLTGAGFTGATAVTFGTVPAAGFTVLDATTIRATAPPGTGAAAVTVTTAGGTPTAVGSYTYQGVGAISPSSGPAAGGTAVTITGSGLGQASQVRFGAAAVAFTQVSDTEIQVISPPGQGVADLQVVTPYGTTPVGAADRFTYTASAGAASARTLPHAAAVSSTRVSSTPVRTRAVPAPAVRTAAASPAAATISVDTIELITETVDKTLPALFTAKNTNELLTTMREALGHYDCHTSLPFLKSAITLAVTPLVDVFTDSLLGPLLLAESIAAGATLVAAIALPITIFLVNFAVDKLVERLIDAEANAFLGECTDPPVPGAFAPNALIDPSGTVVDGKGNPISGATVTLLRSDTADGPFTAVAPASPGIAPAVNPQTTATDGSFHWDVSAGFYEIQATAPGCTDAADPAKAAATIGPFPVPPPQIGLLVTMACANEPPAPVPVLRAISQDSGAASGGDTLLLTGTGFTPGATVTFGGAAAPTTYVAPGTLSVVTPPGHGAVDVTVRTPGGASATTPADRFYFGAAPTVTGLSSTNGPTAGGGSLTITGTGFTGATGVSIGRVPATGVTVLSDTRIQATIPANPAGTGDVTVLNPAGLSALTAADRYTYADTAPRFTAASPPVSATAGTGYGYTFAASGTPAPTYALAPGAPAWLSVDAATGALRGTPPAGTTRFGYTVTAANSAGTATAGPFTVTVAAAVTGPTVDTTTTVTGRTALTVRARSTAPGELLVAFVAADGPAKPTQQATVSGGGLNWSLAGRTNTRYGTSEIWTARAPKAGTVSVRGTLARSGYGQQLTVIAFAAATGVGRAVHAQGGSGAPGASLTTSAAGSWVFGVGNDWDRSVKRTVGPGQLLRAQATDTFGDTYWVQSTTAPTRTKGTAVRVNDLAPVNDRWNLTLVEILGPKA